MNILKELQDGPGFAVFNIEDISVFKKLRNSLLKKFYSDNKKQDINSLRKSFAKMNKVEINRAMIKLLSFTNLSEMIISIMPKNDKKFMWKRIVYSEESSCNNKFTRKRASKTMAPL